jgi:hypothetical protein
VIRWRLSVGSIDELFTSLLHGFTKPQDTHAPQGTTMATPEELIEEMTTLELQELLGELGLEATESQATGIKSLVKQLGTLEAALEMISSFQNETRRAA